MSRESKGPAAPELELDPELQRALADLGRPGAGGAPDLEALRASIDAELAAERGWLAFLRSRATPVRVALAVVALAAAALGIGLVAARVDLAVYPPWRLALGLGVMLVCFLVSVALALRPLSRPLAAPGVVRWTLALVPLALAALYMLPAAHADHPVSLPQAEPLAVVLRALPCFGTGSVIALGSALLLGALHRGGNRAALLLASAGGVAANVLLLLHCAMTAPAHMLLGHLGVLLVAVAVAPLLQGHRR